MSRTSKQAEDYAARMERAAAAIAASLRRDEEPRVADLANASALSPYHFHRVYRLLAGETVGQTVQRLKLARALALVDEGESVTGAAHSSGYESSQSLAKAVKKRTGQTISGLRSAGALAPHIDKLSIGTGDHAMRFELIDHSPVTIACRLVTGPYAQLNLAYRALFEEVCAAVDPDQISGVYGIPVDDPRHVPDDQHRFVSALSLEPAPGALAETIELRPLGGGRYARAKFVGPYELVPGAIDDVYRSVIEAGCALRDSETFLHYVDQPSADEGPDVTHETHIYVPVQA